MTRQRAASLVEDMIACIAKINLYTAGMTEAAFLESNLIQDAVARNLEIIGEAVAKLQAVAPEMVRDTKHIPWHLARGMRNVIAHDYAGVNYQRVWKTIESELPQFKAQLEALLTSLAAH